MKKKTIFTALTGLLLMTACGEKQAGERIVSVTIEPQRYFVEKIAGNKFTVNTVVPAGQEPESYDPTPRQMVQVSKSRAYLQIGHIPFEETFMKSVRENNPDMKVFILSDGVNLITHEEHDHKHGEEEAAHHSHVGVDPHTWSSISGAKTIAWNTLSAFIELDRENTQFYWNNYNRLMSEIEQTEKALGELLNPVENRTFIIYHPALTYFARDYNLNQLSVEMEGKEPSPTQLKRLIDLAKKTDAKVAFIQQEFDVKNAELIANETNCRLVVINPLSYDWSEELIHVAQSLADGKDN